MIPQTGSIHWEKEHQVSSISWFLPLLAFIDYELGKPESDGLASSEDEGAVEEEIPVKRGRGRPRKTDTPLVKTSNSTGNQNQNFFPERALHYIEIIIHSMDGNPQCFRGCQIS